MDSQLATALDVHIRDFLLHQRSLGRRYYTEEYVLRGLRDFVADTGAVDLDKAVFDHWCEHLRPLAANTRRSRQLIVRKLCLFRRRSDSR